MPDGTWHKVYQSEVIMKTLNPKWKSFSMKAAVLNNGDFFRPIKFQIFDWDRMSSHDLIGEFTASTDELQKTRVFKVVHPQKKGKKSYDNSGTVVVNACDVKKEYSFLDYLSGGCQINLMVAIDFTASNGDPRFTNSLHYRNPYQPNEYEKAIQTIGSILAPYDWDGNFPGSL